MREMKFQLKSGEYLIIYLRKSRQDDENESIESVLARHERQLQDYAVRLTGEIIPPERIYREVVSGETISERIEFQKVMEEIRNPKCVGCLVIDIPRLSRGELTDIGAVIASFRYSSSLIMTPNPDRIFNLEDEYDRDYVERELMRGKDYGTYTRTILNRGKKQSFREGNWIHSKPPYGYERIQIGKNWTLAINEKEAEMVRKIFDWYINEGIGAHAIAVRLNELGYKPRIKERFTPCAIRNILVNVTYTGKLKWGQKATVRSFEDGKVVKKRQRAKEYEIVQGKHPAIISDEVFALAQERKGKMTKEKPDSTLKNVLAGIIKCKKCGKALAFQSHKGRKDRLHCRTGGQYCDNKSSNYDIVLEAVLNGLRAHLKDFEIEINTDNDKEVKEHEKLLKRLEKESADIEKRQAKLYELLEKDLYTPEVFRARNDALAQEREELEHQMKKARLYKPSMERQQQRYYSLFEAINAMENPTISAKQKNILLKNIIDVIYYEKNEIDYTHGATLENTNFKIAIILK